MTDLVRQTLLHLLLPVAAIAGVLVAAVATALPLWLAFECGRRAHGRRALAQTRAQTRARISHITERAKERLATERAVAEIANDGSCWLEISDGEDGDAIDPAGLAAPDECAPHPSRSSTGGCRDLAQENEEHDDLAPLPALSLAVASPDSLLAGLFSASRADIPDPVRAQLPSVVAATYDLAAEICDASGFTADHRGRRNAERAVLAAFAYGVRPIGPHRIARN